MDRHSFADWQSLPAGGEHSPLPCYLESRNFCWLQGLKLD
jgi:hypothetical protein